MKKSIILFLFVLVTSGIFAVNFIHAFDYSDAQNTLDSSTSNLPSNPDELKDQSTAYLKQEWTKILEKNDFGKILLSISNIFKTLSPLFKIFIGVEYSLSWLFFLSLGFGIFVFIIIYKALNAFAIFKPWMSISITFIILAIVNQFGILPKILGLFVPLFTNKWVILVSILIAVIILVAYSILMKYLLKKAKEKRNKAREERRESKAKTVEKLHDVDIRATGGK